MKKLFLAMIAFYRKRISPLKPPCCKYYPTCSAYAMEAIEVRGAFVGLFLALWRFLRCNPFSKGGYDPVPLRGEKRRKPTEPQPGDCMDAVEAYARHSDRDRKNHSTSSTPTVDPEATDRETQENNQ